MPSRLCYQLRGVLGNAVYFLGLSEKHLVKLLQNEVAQGLQIYIEAATEQGRPPREIAMDNLLSGIEQCSEGGRSNSLKSGAISLAKFFVRKDLLPKKILRPFSFQFIRNSIGGKGLLG